MKVYQVIARALGARIRCEQANNREWIVKHQDRIDELVEDFPHGSGYDSGTKLDDSSTEERLVFNTAFHHMNENGMYDGWTEHQVIVTPSLETGYSMRITGRDRNQIKEMMADDFHMALDKDIEEYRKEAVYGNNVMELYLQGNLEDGLDEVENETQ